jgi:Holin of 3TMs, for gene-transfer release
VPLFDILTGPVSKLLDKIIPDPRARDAAKLELLALQGTQELDTLKTQMAAILAEAQLIDPWTSRARPAFLYVMYVIILWAIPMGVIAAFAPATATGIANGMNGYLSGIPDSLWGLFGTGYLGYTAARQWEKVRAARITP